MNNDLQKYISNGYEPHECDNFSQSVLAADINQLNKNEQNDLYQLLANFLIYMAEHKDYSALDKICNELEQRIIE